MVWILLVCVCVSFSVWILIVLIMFFVLMLVICVMLCDWLVWLGRFVCCCGCCGLGLRFWY